MATRTGRTSWENDGRFKAAWVGITEADDGAGVAVPDGIGALTAQVVGDFTSSGAITWQGSNDGGTTWGGLSYKGGTAAVMTDATVIKFDQVPAMIRPHASAGSAVVMDAYVFGSR